MHLRDRVFLLAVLTGFFFSPMDQARAAEPSPSPQPAPAQPGRYEVDRLEGATLYFKDGPKPWNTGLFDPKYLGTLHPSEDGVPYFLFTARACRDCAQDRVVYLMRPEGNERMHQFVYPGRITDPKSKTRAVSRHGRRARIEQPISNLVLESHAYFGKCLPNMGDIYVVKQTERVDRKNSMQPSIFIAEPLAEHLHEKLVENSTYRRLERAIKANVQAKRCFEIEGRNRPVSDKTLDLSPRHVDENDADDNKDDDGKDDDSGDETETPPAPGT